MYYMSNSCKTIDDNFITSVAKNKHKANTNYYGLKYGHSHDALAPSTGTLARGNGGTF